jgi:hypothetical protein
MVGFATTFVLAVRWRRRPELHRRLMFMATAVLTAAAWGRMSFLDHAEWFYAAVDLLIAIAALRDLVVERRIHRVYLVGLPVLMFGQLLLATLRWSDWCWRWRRACFADPARCRRNDCALRRRGIMSVRRRGSRNR